MLFGELQRADVLPLNDAPSSQVTFSPQPARVCAKLAVRVTNKPAAVRSLKRLHLNSLTFKYPASDPACADGTVSLTAGNRLHFSPNLRFFFLAVLFERDFGGGAKYKLG